MQERCEKSQFFSGLRAGLPIALGYLPVAVAYALAARQAGMSAAETVLMSLLVYAGASQVMAVGMLASGSAALSIVLAAFLLNLRHLLMSACVFRELPEKSLAGRLSRAFLITDETFAVFLAQQKKDRTSPFFLGLSLLSYTSWVGGSALGAFASGLLPETLLSSFSIALYALFIALLVPGLSGRPRLLFPVLLTAAVHALLSHFLTSGWALILSTVLGAAGGTLFLETTESDTEEKP